MSCSVDITIDAGELGALLDNEAFVYLFNPPTLYARVCAPTMGMIMVETSTAHPNKIYFLVDIEKRSYYDRAALPDRASR